jgi:hypothetical protein
MNRHASVLTTIVGFLGDRKMESVTTEFAFDLARDLHGEDTEPLHRTARQIGGPGCQKLYGPRGIW